MPGPTPINALIGVWAFAGGGGISFFMGSAGSEVVPAGTSELFLGTMDGYGWANNVGAFRVEITGVPDAGSTGMLLGSVVAGLALLRRRLA
jgi:hypothetical protein